MTNTDSISILSRLAYSGNLPHALLFAGLDTGSKQDIALKFSKWLLHPKRDSARLAGPTYAKDESISLQKFLLSPSR